MIVSEKSVISNDWTSFGEPKQKFTGAFRFQVEYFA